MYVVIDVRGGGGQRGGLHRERPSARIARVARVARLARGARVARVARRLPPSEGATAEHMAKK